MLTKTMFKLSTHTMHTALIETQIPMHQFDCVAKLPFCLWKHTTKKDLIASIPGPLGFLLKSAYGWGVDKMGRRGDQTQ